LLITTGTFTAEAKREATRDGAPPVELIDGQDLCDLLRAYNVGVATYMVEQVELDDAFFAELQKRTTRRLGTGRAACQSARSKPRIAGKGGL
jgi:hypothetical protein